MKKKKIDPIRNLIEEKEIFFYKCKQKVSVQALLCIT